MTPDQPVTPDQAPAPTRILVVDNYDSFVFNLVHYLAQLGAEVEVRRNDEVGDLDAVAAGFDGVLLSPGPGTPEDAGVCVELVRTLGGRVPVFGVCLGLQAIAVAYGGVVGRAPELLHGKTSPVDHDDRGALKDLPNPFTATRYHSLAITTLPDALEVSARTPSGVIMAARHRELAVEAVQFHPESVLTQAGHHLLANWLTACGSTVALDRLAALPPEPFAALAGR